ncbi:MAG: OadG family protein [Clostridia bacterium]|nr:OadG family protein [Clostridia bacterium]
MSLLSKIFGSGKGENGEAVRENVSRSESAAALQPREEKDPGELVAVIMAALMHMMSNEASSELRIKSIRRIGRNSPVWNTAGRDEYIMSKL